MSSPSPTRLSGSRFPTKAPPQKAAAELQSMAQLVEDSIPSLKKDEDKKFYRKVVKSYRDAARDILRKA